jgi:hypothetical protein
MRHPSPISHLRESIFSPHIPYVTRRDQITLAWLLPSTVFLSLWWVFHADPCMDNVLAAQWRRWFPPAPVPQSVEPGALVIEKPYDILACDYWPTAHEHVTSVVAFIVIVSLAGFLAARRFEDQPVKRAGLITGAALLIVSCLSLLAFHARQYGQDQVDYAALAWSVSVSLMIILPGVLLTMFTAWLSRKPRHDG